jgi:hypothetical protein
MSYFDAVFRMNPQAYFGWTYVSITTAGSLLLGHIFTTGKTAAAMPGSTVINLATIFPFAPETPVEKIEVDGWESWDYEDYFQMEKNMGIGKIWDFSQCQWLYNQHADTFPGQSHLIGRC